MAVLLIAEDEKICKILLSILCNKADTLAF